MAKKLWERVQEDIEKNRQVSEQIRINANNQFNSMWDKVQSVANNNLDRFNDMQKSIDVNTRNQMARNMEDFTNRKRTAMQSVSNVIQENSNNKRKPLSTIRNSSNEGEDINIVSKKGREKLTSSIKKQIGENILELSNSIGHYDNGNRIKIYRDDSGQIDKNRTDLEIAQKSFEEDKRKLQMIENKKIFEKAMNEQLKNTLNYKVAKRQNPNATDEELLKIAKEKEIKSSQEFIEWLADMDPGRRNAMIEDFTYNKNQKYDLKSRVQAIETQREADKINQDAQNGNYWSSIGHVAKGLPEGAINSVAKTAATLESLSNGKHYNTLVNPNYDSVLETKLRTRKYQETTSKIDNGIVQTASGVSNTIGEMAPSMLVNVAAPGYGAVLNAVNVGSSGYLDTLNEDSSNKLQAVATGLPKALASYGIEKIIGGNFLSEGSLDDWAAEVIAKKTAGITNKTANKVAQKVASKIYEVGGEVFEEELENQVDYLIDATINDKGISLREWLDEQEETVKNTALTQLTLGLFGLGGDTYKKVKEYEANADTKTWINEAQKIIDKENLEINTDEIKKRELRNVVNKVDIKEDNEVNNKSSDLQQNTTDNSIKPLTQQTTSQENKVAQNGNVEQTNNDTKKQLKKQRLEELKSIDTSEMGLLERTKIRNEIKALEQGYNSVDEYKEAERLKEDKAKQEYTQKQERKAIKNTENSNYQMQHRPTQNGIGYDITSTESIGKDFYTNPENYVDMSRTYNQESYQAIKSIEGNPEAEITVYRASPVNELNDGDWISLSKEYATMEAQKENVQVNEFKVKAKDIQWAGDDINEFGYFPNEFANNQQTVYNNTESEGGINGREEIRQSNGDVFKQFTNETNTQSQKTNNAREEFEKRFREATRKRINEEEISENSKNNRKILKDVYGTDIFFIEDNLEFSGGADERLNLMNLTREIANSKDNNVATGHELFEVIRNTREDIKNEYIEPLIDVVENDNNFNDVLKKYVDNCETKDKQLLLDNPRYIAKEVLFDEAGFMFNEDEFKLGVNKQETDLIRFSDYLTSNKSILQIGLSNIEQKARVKNVSSINNKIEAETKSLGYKTDIEGKQRKHYKSIMESDQVGEAGKQSAKSLLENDTYEPLSNIDTLATANANINRNGVDNTYIAFRSKLNSNERITLQDIATGERLIQIFSQNGDIEKVNGLIQDVAMLGTELGQQVQAMSLIKKMSPEGQLMYLNKMVDRLNLKENADLKVTDEMSKRILETKGQEELDNVMTDIAIELGEQLPVTTRDKIRSWRYLSMLGNPKTHIKNLGANVAMNVTQQIKNKVAGATEDIVGIFNKDMERTKTLKFANKDQKSFAKKDAEFMKDKIDGGGKYDIKNAIQSNKRQFDNKTLNAIADFNSNMLELEDNIFLKKAYQQAMQNYMSANKLSSSDMENSSVLQKAREYASYQAQEATFHQFSELAKRLTEIENKGGIAGKALEAVIPFKKTPINIAKSGVEYSPIGLVKSLTFDLAQLNKKTKDYKAKLDKGLISEADYKTGTSKLVTKTIDNVAKGFTGTSLALIGYALKDMGILKSGNDDEDDEFREKLGEQEYAIRIGNNTYTLDWVSPSAIPMFMGATVHDLMHSENEDNSNTLNSLMTSSAKALEPMTEMSMLQGLTSAITSYEQGSSKLFDLGASAVSSYLGQFVPTALGQVAKTIDDKERDTSSTEKGLAKKVDQFKKQQVAKIPIASKLLPARKDVWGNEKTRDSNPLVRAYEVGLAPYNRKKVVEDYTEKELLKVFEDTGEKSVLPGILDKDITINKQKYRLTSEEYNKAKETFGKTSKSMLDSLVKTSEYKQLSDEQKASAIDDIYSYAKEKIKVDYAKGKKQKVETSSLYNVLQELRSSRNQSEYLNYVSKTKGIEKDKEKKQILVDSYYSSTTKSIIYKNTIGKDDNLYNDVLAKDNISINEYLNYSLQEFESDKEDDGTKQGRTISGSKKEKVQNYVNSMNITKVQRLAILGTQYKLKRVEQEELYNYLDKVLTQTEEKRLEIFSKYSKNFTIYEDNTIDFK